MTSISDSDKSKLLQAALDARQHSYSPYSKFRVGAAILIEWVILIFSQGSKLMTAPVVLAKSSKVVISKMQHTRPEYAQKDQHFAQLSVKERRISKPSLFRAT